MQRCHSLLIALASLLTCLALGLSLCATAPAALAASTPHITISDVSQEPDPTCLTFTIAGRGFSANSQTELDAIAPSTGMHFQPDQVQTSKHGNFSTTAQGCVPNHQGSSIQFFVKAIDGKTGKVSNLAHVSYDTSTRMAPSLRIAGIAVASPACLTFQLRGLGFPANSSVALAVAPSTATIRPAYVHPPDSGDFSIEETACDPSQQGGSIQFSVSAAAGPTGPQSNTVQVDSPLSTSMAPNPVPSSDQPILPGSSPIAGCDPPSSVTNACVATPTPADQCPVGVSQPSDACVATPTPADLCFASGNQLPGSCQNQDALFYLLARDEHTNVTTSPYAVAYDGQPVVPGSSLTSGAPTLFISNLSQGSSATCLTFRVVGQGFSHRLHVDLSGQDPQGTAVTLTPDRVLTDTHGAFSKKVQACGNFSAFAGQAQITSVWCDIPFIADFFC